MTASWVAVVDELAADRSVRVVVVTGQGSAFWSGGDTSWSASEPGATVDQLRTRMLPDAVGPARARDLLLTGRVVDADDALRLGLVSRVLAPKGFLDEVLATARDIAAAAPIATRLTKLALADGGHADFESGLQWEARAQPLTLATEDLQDGIRAARDKRTPTFHGR